MGTTTNGQETAQNQWIKIEIIGAGAPVVYTNPLDGYAEIHCNGFDFTPVNIQAFLGIQCYDTTNNHTTVWSKHGERTYGGLEGDAVIFDSISLYWPCGP